MILLILGIVLFLSTLTTWRVPRAAAVARIGANAYRGLHSLASLGGLVLIGWGFHLYRAEGWVQLWSPPSWTRHVTIFLMWFAFVAFACANPAPSRMRGWLRHPMLVAVKIWALAHLVANGDLGGVILFGSLLAWAVYDRIAVKRRGDPGAPPIARFTGADAMNLAIGTAAYVAMIFLHPLLIGVAVVG